MKNITLQVTNNQDDGTMWLLILFLLAVLFFILATISKHYTNERKKMDKRNFLLNNLGINSGIKEVKEIPLLESGIEIHLPDQLKDIRESYLVKRKWIMPSNLIEEGIPVSFNELPLWWQDWLREGNELPLWWFSLIYSAYHILIVARTRGGKSQITYSLIQDILAASSQNNKVVILDPHGSEWGEILPIGREVNFPAIRHSMRVILAEMYIRLNKYSNGERNFDGLYIIMDESPAIKDELEEAFINFIKAIAQNAAKVNIHLVILTQSKLVKDLGLEGRSDMRKAFSMLLLSNEAIKELPEEYIEDKNPYPVVLNYDDYSKKVNRNFVPFVNKYKSIKKEGQFIIEGLPKAPSIEELVNSKIPLEDIPVKPKRVYNKKEKKDG